jgi:hypothetical protein
MTQEVKLSPHQNFNINNLAGAKVRLESFTSSHDRLELRMQFGDKTYLLTATFCEKLDICTNWISSGLFIEEIPGLILIKDGNVNITCRELLIWAVKNGDELELEYSRRPISLP